jgi:hypothetical protein
MKLAKTIQLDVSDTHVFERPAEVGEWAITGTFAFVDSDPSNWSSKQQLAFRTAWLGIDSFGNSTFVQVVEMDTPEYEQAIQTLSTYLTDVYNAPSQEAAQQAAQQEIDDMVTMCDHPMGTLLSIERSIDEQGITEKTSVMAPSGSTSHTKIWAIVEDD